MVCGKKTTNEIYQKHKFIFIYFLSLYCWATAARQFIFRALSLFFSQKIMSYHLLMCLKMLLFQFGFFSRFYPRFYYYISGIWYGRQYFIQCYRLKDKETWKMSVKSELGSFRPMNSFNLILALLSSAFFITLCLQVGVFDNFDTCKFVGIECKCVCK